MALNTYVWGSRYTTTPLVGSDYISSSDLAHADVRSGVPRAPLMVDLVVPSWLYGEDTASLANAKVFAEDHEGSETRLWWRVYGMGWSGDGVMIAIDAAVLEATEDDEEAFAIRELIEEMEENESPYIDEDAASDMEHELQNEQFPAAAGDEAFIPRMVALLCLAGADPVGNQLDVSAAGELQVLLEERPGLEIAGRTYRDGTALRDWLEESTGFADVMTPSATEAFYGLGDLFGVYPHTEGNSDFVYHFDDWLEKFAAALDGLSAFLAEVAFRSGGTNEAGEPITEDDVERLVAGELSGVLTQMADSLMGLPLLTAAGRNDTGLWTYGQKWYRLIDAGLTLHRMRKGEREVLVDNVLGGGLDSYRVLKLLEESGLAMVKKPFAGLRRA